MSQTSDHAELFELTAAEVDGSITESQHAHLAELLTQSADARAAYLRYRRLHASLDWRTGEFASGTKPRPAVAVPHDDATAESYPIYRKGHEPNSAISNFKFSIFNFQFQLIAAALLAACGLAIYFLALNPEPSPPEPPAQPLATLIESTPGSTLTTPGGFISEGRDYPRGRYTLSGGTAEFMLTNSVNVKLRGRTRMVMHNDKNVSLTRGSASFVVPEAAVGFAVRLPDQSRIVDLGTAFHVTLDDAGRSQLVVNDGTVAWYAGGDAAVLINADQRASLVDGQPVLFEVPKRAIDHYASGVPETMAIARLEPGVARLNGYLDARIATPPPALADLYAIIPPRGEGNAPGAGYRFTLKHPARLFLLVHDRGGFAPDGWERTEHTIAWTVSGQSHADTVYTRLAQPGDIEIPAHTGRLANGMHGVPHVCLIAPLNPQTHPPAQQNTGATK